MTIVLILTCAIHIAGAAKFYNFMDGINGISGITGIVGFGLIAFHGCYSGKEADFSALAICISVSCIGFLPFNMLRAPVFMGDVGAILLGFVFAGMVVMLTKNLLDFIYLAAFLLPFYADELGTMVVRTKDRDKLTQAHRKHLYQLLTNEKGIAHWKISVGYGLTQLLIGLIVIALEPFGLTAILAVLTLFFSTFILANLRLKSTIRQ